MAKVVFFLISLLHSLLIRVRHIKFLKKREDDETGRNRRGTQVSHEMRDDTLNNRTQMSLGGKRHSRL